MMKRILIALALVGTCFGSVWASAAEFNRQRLLMDYGWKFVRSDAKGAEAPAFDDAPWRALDLPHDWSIEGPFGQNQPTGGPGGYLPTGIGWYRKTFPLPASWKDRKVFIEFDGVYENSEVWINGHLLGKRPFGYISFSYDLTDHLRLDGTNNVLAVRVDNSAQPNSRWYSGSGIYRHTWLLITDKVHVDQWGTFVTTPQVARESSTIQFKTQVKNEGTNNVKCTLSTNILDKDGKVVKSLELTGEIPAGGEREFVDQLIVDKPNLWSVETPYLYKVQNIVKEQDRLVDQYETPMGIREVRFDPEKGCLLNCERVKLNGVCLHHDGGCVGAAVPEAVWQRRLELLREMGCNAIRTSHNPPAPEFLDLCDKLGFLVMDEAFDEWRAAKGQVRHGYHLNFDTWSERDVTSMICHDRNHPSVVIWSAGNEVPDQTASRGAAALEHLMNIFHKLDSTRPVTVGCDQIAAEPRSATPEFLALLDIVGYNYVDRWRDRREKYYSIDKLAFPQRLVIGTESGAMGGVRGDYRTGRGVNTDVEQLWKFVKSYDYVIGDFMWTGIDYLGEARWPSKSSSSGVIDTCGFKKDGYYFYQSQWTYKPMVHLFPHWNWPGREGQIIPVTCYTNCDTVELFLNGKSFGVKGYSFPRYGMEGRYGNYSARTRRTRTTSDLHLSWDVPYAPGTLRAVGTKNARVVCTEEVSTTGAPAAIALAIDRRFIAADRRDVAHVTVQITDDQGRMAPAADNEVTFEIRGEGKIIGVDNGNPASHEDFKANRRRAFNGLCLAIVQATAKPGKIHLAARAQGLKEAVIEIESQPPQSLPNLLGD